MSRRSLELGLMTALLVAAVGLTGCSGDDGAPGAPGASTGTITGAVTNTANAGAPVVGAAIITTPGVPGLAITTDANGVYTADLPVGNYTIAVTAPNFVAGGASVSVLAAVSQTFDFPLAPVSNVVIAFSGSPDDAVPGSVFMLTADVTPMDGSTVQSYNWTQTQSAMASIADGTTPTATITLGDSAEYKRVLIEHLPVLDRFEVLSVDPHAYELAGMVAFQCEVTTSSGTYTNEVEVHADLEFATWCTGLPNVPTDSPVLVGGADQPAYNWTFVKPGSSAATLMDADTRFPWFVPDVGGAYSVTETNAAETIDFRAGDWWGAIDGLDSSGRPMMSVCTTSCHAVLHNDKFVDWAETGHAEIFTNNINTGGHYGPGCFSCHTVGYDEGGMDSTTGYSDFLDAMFPGGQSHPNPNNFNTVLANHPEQAKYSNIQCDNCHGPTGSGSAHQMGADMRVSVSAGVCGRCHGEPPRHARYQQWLESGHGNFQLAIDESSGSCAKCHTAQGHLDWADAGWDASFSGTSIDPAVVQPITCVVCHDPHNVGTQSGANSHAPLRLEGDTPELLGGFTAYGVGKGAMCIVCHNTRRGEADDVITSTPDRAPHGGAQGDVLLGKNGFWVNNVRGPHSLIVDTCANCHVERTPPPADLSYQLGGTNHTFEADVAICADCHGGFTADSVIQNTERALAELADKIEMALAAEIAFHIGAGRTVEVTGADANGDPLVVVIGASSTVGEIVLTETHGRAAMDIDVDNGAGMVHVSHVRLNSDTKILVGGTWDNSSRLLSNAFSMNVGVIARAQWNYFMIHNDSSGGIHNPGWVGEMIVATAQQIDAILP